MAFFLDLGEGETTLNASLATQQFIRLRKQGAQFDEKRLFDNASPFLDRATRMWIIDEGQVPVAFGSLR